MNEHSPAVTATIHLPKPIWKTEYDARTHILAIEMRNRETHDVAFGVINLHTNLFYSLPIPLEEPWWIGLETIHRNFLVLHGYQEIGKPLRKGITGFNIKTQKSEFNFPDVSFHAKLENGLILMRNEPEPSWLKVLFTNTDQLIPCTNTELSAENFISKAEGIYNAIEFEKDAPNYGEIQRQIQSILGVFIESTISLIQVGNTSIVFYYLPQAQNFNFLMAFISAGKLILEQTLEADLIDCTHFPIVLLGDTLVYVRKKLEIVLAKLSNQVHHSHE